MPNRRTALYRHWNAEGTLLYIGQAYDGLNRFTKHLRDSQKWSLDVALSTTEYFDNKALAIKAEGIAIKAEKPKFNIMLNNDRLIPDPDKRKQKIKVRKRLCVSFLDLPDNEKNLFMACATLAKETNDRLSMDGEFTISASYFSILFNMTRDDSFNYIRKATSDMFKTETRSDHGGEKHILGGISVRQETRSVKLGFNGDMESITDHLKTCSEFIEIKKLSESIDKSSCKAEYWPDYFARINAENEAMDNAYLEKHNCVGQSFDAIYHCAANNNYCDMGSFLAPSSMRDNPPPCDECGGKTEFECMYE